MLSAVADTRQAFGAAFVCRQLDHHVRHHWLGTTDSQSAGRNVYTGADTGSDNAIAFVRRCNRAGNRQPRGPSSISKYMLKGSNVADDDVRWISLQRCGITEIH